MKLTKEMTQFPSALLEVLPKSVGFSFYKTWHFLSLFYALSYVHHDVIVMGIPIDKFYSVTQLLSTVIFFVLLGMVLPIKHLPLNKYRSLYLAAALFAGAGTIIPTLNTSSYLLTILCPVLTGFGEALILLMWGEYCSSIGFRQTGLFLLLSYLMSVGFFYIAVYIPAMVAFWLVPAYPIISVLFLFLGRKPAIQYCEDTVKSVDHQVFPLLRRSWLWKVFLSLAVLGFSVDLSRYTVKSIELTVINNNHVTITAVVVTAILTLIGVALFRKKGRFKIIANLVIIVVAIGFVLIPFMDSSQGILITTLLTSGRTCFFIVAWIIFSNITHSFRIPAAKVFGWGRALTVGGSFLGVLIGSFIVTISSVNETLLMVIALANLFLLVLSAVLLLDGYTKALKLEAPTEAPTEEPTESAKQALEIISEEHGLTPREKEVVALLIKGRSLPYIEKELYISHGTSNTHVQNIYRKLGVHSRQELLDTYQAAEEAEEVEESDNRMIE